MHITNAIPLPEQMGNPVLDKAASSVILFLP